MAHAETCPVCNGTGVFIKYDKSLNGRYETRNCHGCDGRGWVKVEDVYVEHEILRPVKVI